MKFTPEVVAALATLREHAENDFERHRIDALERDLTAPPTVEVVDDTHQKFNGVVYSKNVKGRYACSGTIHRDVWTYFNGEIPEGYEIHHIDGSPANNTIDNLQCLAQSVHRTLHAPHGTPLPKQKKKFTCIVCGAEYQAYNTGHNRFCSAKCRNKSYRVDAHLYKLTCQQCGKDFFATTDQARFCSRTCIGIARRSVNQTTKICPVCGKSFRVKKSAKRKCCSKECMYKLLSQQFSKAKQ